MKKMFSLMLLVITSFICFTSCSNEEDVYIPQEVEFTLDYTFIESGSMAKNNGTRATGTELYDKFYEKYIKTKILTPKTFYMEFKNDQEIVLTINGQEWEQEKGIRLPAGEYTVTGYSYPVENYTDKPQYLPSDTVYLRFNEKVKITKDTKRLTLNAIYDSFLLLFDIAEKSGIELGVGQKWLKNDESCYWVFSKEKSWTNWDNGFAFEHYLTAYIHMYGMDRLEIVLGKLPIEKGKYYYFNDMKNSFDIPKMESGN